MNAYSENTMVQAALLEQLAALGCAALGAGGGETDGADRPLGALGGERQAVRVGAGWGARDVAERADGDG